MDRGSASLRVGLVDDDTASRLALRGEVARALPDADVVEANDAAAFEALLRGPSLDAAVVSRTVAWADRLDVLRTLREAHPGCAVVVSDDDDAAEAAVAALKAGADDYVPRRAAAGGRLAEALVEAVGRQGRLAEGRRAERSLRDALRALQAAHDDQQQFAYAISHDLQEPLRQVRAFSGLLRDRHAAQLAGEAAEFLDYVHRGALRLEAMLAGLRAYLKLAGEESVREEVDAGGVLAGVLSGFASALADTGGTVDAGPLPRVAVREAHLHQLFQILIGNAVKYRGASPPRVRVTAEPAGDQVTFLVQDEGVGIDPRYATDVFKVFRRLHADCDEGIGIGLALAQRIVERYGGRIWVEGAPGSGASFYFTVPGAAGPDGSGA